ncbi:phospholipase D/nuclease, partial [Cadophora sp. DSE1049]
EKSEHSHTGEALHSGTDHHDHRYHSFAPQREECNAKWYTDTCGYFWALSSAIEKAQHDIWVMGWWLSPEVYLRRPPARNMQYRLDRMLQAAAMRGVRVNIIINNVNTSLQTKIAFENLHETIVVVRHSYRPETILQTTKTNDINPSSTPDICWCNHEKLCIFDGRVAFMGGVDVCFGRWDTNAYPIADAHPNNPQEILCPGQDFKNARAFDFTQPDHPKENRLNRNIDYRMGWTDPAVCLEGPVLQDLVAHFAQRWNYERARNCGAGLQAKTTKLSLEIQGYTCNGIGKMPAVNSVNENSDEHESIGSTVSNTDNTAGKAPRRGQKHGEARASMSMQTVRSVCEWNHGTITEHSILNAYLDTIEKSQHFLYFEHQYFITATTEEQYPVLNKIGRSIVNRILRAARAKEKFKVIVVMPAVPAFAGDIQYDSSPGTLAIMGFQYKSISRGGSSIIEKIREAGFNPEDYISFYNLRSYDRINASASTDVPEKNSDASHGDICKKYEKTVGDALNTSSGSISSAYMLNGPSLSFFPWDNGNVDEIDAFVSEEVYVHSKLLIADDQVVIVGSANLEDRSMLGYRDSELAIVIEDPVMIDSRMDGEPFKASRFAASMRRNLFRKHLGLVSGQDPTKPDENFLPVDKFDNLYDWGSDSDLLVEDPLSDTFEELWSHTARTNTEVFDKVFRQVPSNAVRNWQQYHEYYGQYFDVKKGSMEEPKYRYGHVFKENFPGGVQDVKSELERVRGTLVEMPLDYLVDVNDLEKEGFDDQPFQAEIYT